MLIQRRSPKRTSSMRGSVASRRAESTRARAERLRRGFGRLGIGSEGVVQHVHYPRFYPQTLVSSAAHIAVASRGVEGNGPVKPRQPLGRRSRLLGKVPIPLDVTGRLDKASVTAPAEVFDFERGFCQCQSRRSSARNVTRPTRSTLATCA